MGDLDSYRQIWHGGGPTISRRLASDVATRGGFPERKGHRPHQLLGVAEFGMRVGYLKAYTPPTVYGLYVRRNGESRHARVSAGVRR